MLIERQPLSGSTKSTTWIFCNGIDNLSKSPMTLSGCARCGLLSKPQAAAEAQWCRGAAGTLTLCKTLLHLCLCSGGTVADSQVITQHWVQQREGATPHTSVQKHLFTWSTHHTAPPAQSYSPAHRPHLNTRSTLCQGELEGLGPERVQTVPLARVRLNLLWRWRVSTV